MIKIFESKTEDEAGVMREKINFVDSDNVFLGYDMSSKCCENYGWFISDEPQRTIQPQPSHTDFDLAKYFFDEFYFRRVLVEEDGRTETILVFRIEKEDMSEEKYIHIYNAQNGYYSHGFEFKSTCNPNSGAI